MKKNKREIIKVFTEFVRGYGRLVIRSASVCSRHPSPTNRGYPTAPVPLQVFHPFLTTYVLVGVPASRDLQCCHQLLPSKIRNVMRGIGVSLHIGIEDSVFTRMDSIVVVSGLSTFNTKPFSVISLLIFQLRHPRSCQSVHVTAD